MSRAVDALGLRPLGPGLHVLDRRFRFFGVEIGTRMTVLALADGLLVHSPVDLDPAALAGLGEPRWVIAPNLFHHLYVGPWIDAGLEAWAAPGLANKRDDLRFAGELAAPGDGPFGDELAVLPLRCFPLANEVVLLHRPSRTLVVSDLLFNLSPTAPWTTRVAFRCIGAYPGVRSSVAERLGMKRELARQELGTILGWDFDRIVLAHGDIVESGGRDALAAAYRWLGFRG